MRLETKKYLYDVARAIDLLTSFTAGKTFDDYCADAMLRAAVERQFEIIGESLSQLSKIDIQVAARISHYRRIVGFRNILIHGYADVDNALVWDIIEANLPLLKQEVGILLRDNI